jgi:hypothetical protein
MRLHADSIKIDTDEGRFELVVETEEAGTLRIDFHGLALQFEDEVRLRLRPYALEACAARATMPAPVDEAGGYELDDPKHPGFHDLMSGIHDNR